MPKQDTDLGESLSKLNVKLSQFKRDVHNFASVAKELFGNLSDLPQRDMDRFRKALANLEEWY